MGLNSIIVRFKKRNEADSSRFSRAFEGGVNEEVERLGEEESPSRSDTGTFQMGKSNYLPLLSYYRYHRQRAISTRVVSSSFIDDLRSAKSRFPSPKTYLICHNYSEVDFAAIVEVHSFFIHQIRHGCAKKKEKRIVQKKI